MLKHEKQYHPFFSFAFAGIPVVVAYAANNGKGIHWKALYIFGIRLACWRTEQIRSI